MSKFNLSLVFLAVFAMTVAVRVVDSPARGEVSDQEAASVYGGACNKGYSITCYSNDNGKSGCPITVSCYAICLLTSCSTTLGSGTPCGGSCCYLSSSGTCSTSGPVAAN